MLLPVFFDRTDTAGAFHAVLEFIFQEFFVIGHQVQQSFCLIFVNVLAVFFRLSLLLFSGFFRKLAILILIAVILVLLLIFVLLFVLVVLILVFIGLVRLIRFFLVLLIFPVLVLFLLIG